MGFLERDGELYLVRNLMDSNYKAIGVLALALNQPYYFEDLSLLTWASAVSLELGPGTALSIKGEGALQAGEGTLEYSVGKRDYTLRGRAAVDRDVLLAGFGVGPVGPPGGLRAGEPGV